MVRLLTAALAWILVLPTGAADFLAGVDASHLRFFEDRGVVYRESGEAQDALQILGRRGINCVRLRLFTSSAAQANADPYNRINNLDYTLALAVRVKKAGLLFLLDFHYSDTWADPGKQARPSAWADLTFPELEQRMTVYSSNCIAAFKAAGAMPDYVQVGNEITSGLLWPEGRVGGAYENPRQWSQLGRLLKAAIRGVRNAAGPEAPRIMIHIDRGGDWPATQWFFDNLQKQEVEFDLLGQSYYPFWHGNLSVLRDCLHRAADRYGKPVVVVETAFPWTHSGPVVGLPATPAGQSNYVHELAGIVRSVPQGRGLGIFWWGTEYQRLAGVATAGFESRSFFDAAGNIQPAADALGRWASPPVIEAKRSGANLLLRWPSGVEGFFLESTTNLGRSLDWMRETNAINTAGVAGEVAVPLTDESARFFRLTTD